MAQPGPTERALHSPAMRRTRTALVVLLLSLAAAGFARHPDREKKFVAVHEGGFVTALAVDPADASSVYAATARGFFASADGGATFEPVPLEREGSFVKAIAFDRRSPGTVYLGTNDGAILSCRGRARECSRIDDRRGSFVSALLADSGAIWVGTNLGVLRTADGGRSWTECSEGLLDRSVTSLAVHRGTLFAGTSSGGVFRSRGGCSPWSRGSEGLANSYVSSLAAVDGPGGGIFAATYNGIYRSTDSGERWTPLSRRLGSPFTLAVAVDPQSGALHAGTAAGLYASRDDGRSWSDASEGLVNRFVTALARGSAPASPLFAGTNGGIYRSDDGGRRWSPVRLAPEEAAAGEPPGASRTEER